MNLEKISTTLYDILGYVLPGFIVIISMCILDATFFHSHTLYLQRLAKHPVATIVLAYIAGLICHVVATWLKNRFPKLFSNNENRLSERIRKRVNQEVRDFYSLQLETEGEELTQLETYQLAEAHNAISGGFQDREVYLAHEGLAKSGMVATTLLALTLLCALFKGGASLQLNNDIKSALRIVWSLTLCSSIFMVWVATLFRSRFLFFNRLKNNYTLLCFLSRRQKEKIAVAPVATVADSLKSTVKPNSTVDNAP